MLNKTNVNTNMFVDANTVDIDNVNTVRNIQQVEIQGTQAGEKHIRLNWTADANRDLKEKLPQSDIVELNELSQVGIIGANVLLNMFETKMLKLYNNCNALQVTNNKYPNTNSKNNDKPLFNRGCRIARKRYHDLRR